MAPITTINIVVWVVIGLIVGIGSALLRRTETPAGLLVDVVIGVIGGFIGGVILNALGGLVGAEVVGVNLGGAVVAIVGAVILVAIWELLRGSPSQ
jgi:uncharacterized membrane protein YeaQ/YmgE (transglycosylase-associated protein family)